MQHLADLCELAPCRLRARLSHHAGDESASQAALAELQLIKARQNQRDTGGGGGRAAGCAKGVAKHIIGKWHYTSMKEKDIKTLCQKSGLPDAILKGDRKALEKLHREFVSCCNAIFVNMNMCLSLHVCMYVCNVILCFCGGGIRGLCMHACMRSVHGDNVCMQVCAYVFV